MGCSGAKFKLDCDQIVCDDRVNRENVHHAVGRSSLTFEVAGPRERLAITLKYNGSELRDSKCPRFPAR